MLKTKNNKDNASTYQLPVLSQCAFSFDFSLEPLLEQRHAQGHAATAPPIRLSV